VRFPGGRRGTDRWPRRPFVSAATPHHGLWCASPGSCSGHPPRRLCPQWSITATRPPRLHPSSAGTGIERPLPQKRSVGRGSVADKAHEPNEYEPKTTALSRCRTCASHQPRSYSVGRPSGSHLRGVAAALPRLWWPHEDRLLHHRSAEKAGPAALPDSLSLSATPTRPSEHPRVPIHHPPVDHDSISVLDQNDQPTSPSASHHTTARTATLHPKGRLKYLFLELSRPSLHLESPSLPVLGVTLIRHWKAGACATA